MEELERWTAHAPNLAEHADNPVHTDAGARAAGYPAAIVAGTTVYALMTHPPAAAWGLDWVAGGGAEVRFRSPVLADEAVDLAPSRVESGAEDGAWLVEARARGEVSATCTAWLNASYWSRRDGEELEPLVEPLDERWAAYGQRAGDDLALYDEHGIVHPAAWPCLANRVFATQLVDGPWVHTRSRVAHLAAAPRDGVAVVRSTVIERFDTRAGRRAIVDCSIEVDDRAVCMIEHEALVDLFDGDHA